LKTATAGKIKLGIAALTGIIQSPLGPGLSIYFEVFDFLTQIGYLITRYQKIIGFQISSITF
jgi:hypothetical protein